jgi:hypothetical protein
MHDVLVQEVAAHTEGLGRFIGWERLTTLLEEDEARAGVSAAS